MTTEHTVDDHDYSADFLRRYADLVIGYCLAYKPTSAVSDTIVYFIPAECAVVEPYLQQAILNAGYQFFDEKVIKKNSDKPVIYIKIVGDNIAKTLYSQEVKKPQKFQKSHLLLVPFPTPAKAAQAHFKFHEYLAASSAALLLNEHDPLACWQEKFRQIHQLQEQLTALDIKSLRVVGEGIELSFSLGEQRVWLGATGRNLPTFEVFTSPDWRTVSGQIQFNIPLNKYGASIENISFDFEKGELTSYHSSNEPQLLKKIIEQEHMNRIGEFSLTDNSISPISTYLANSILDENIGGEFGNCHIALGKSYLKAYAQFSENMSLSDLTKFGFNDSTDHIDFVNTKPKQVFAIDKTGREFLLYKDGKFQKGIYGN